ncbi:K02A2.6-like, partial [Cordylochernes scorpioides]
MSGCPMIVPFCFFRPGEESFEIFVQMFEAAFEANALEEGKRMPIFVSLLDSEMLKLGNDLFFPSTMKEQPYERLIQRIKLHLAPRRKVISQRCRFLKRIQLENESISEYLRKLRHLAMDCTFGEMLEVMLRDRFVAGIKSESLQKKLLQEDDDVTLDRVFSIAVSFELAEQNAKELQNGLVAKMDIVPGGNRKNEARRGWQHGPRMQRRETICFRCGEKNSHLAPACPHKTKSCFKCKRIGHLSRARSLPFSLKKKVETEIDCMVNEGILQPIEYANWAAPIVPVLKKDRSLRICGDFRCTANKAIELDKYPLPSIGEIFSKLSGNTVFSSLDLSRAYLQVRLSEEAKRVVNINTTKGLFAFKRLPYGVAVAPNKFQREMDNLFADMSGVACYIDDILVAGKDHRDHEQKLELIFKRLQEKGLRLNKDKCKFAVNAVEYLGFKIDKKGLHPISSKIEAVVEAPEPTNVSQLRSFIGLLMYYSRFIRNIADILAPFYQLLKKNSKWNWTSEHRILFAKCKALLTNESVLAHYDATRELVLACDASSYGLGVVLSHRNDRKEETPIAFASRTLTEAERRYSQLEKEALSIIFGCEKFRQYLLGREFVLITDNRPLMHIFSPQKPIPICAASRVKRQFVSSEFDEFTKINGIRYTKTSPYNPSTNGLAERYVREFKNSLRKSQGKDSIEINLQRFLFTHRAFPQTVLKESPAELLMKRSLRSRFSNLIPKMAKVGEVYHDAMRKQEHFAVGSDVYFRSFANGPKWERGRVMELLSSRHYLIEDEGRYVKRHINQLRPVIKKEVPEVRDLVLPGTSRDFILPGTSRDHPRLGGQEKTMEEAPEVDEELKGAESSAQEDTPEPEPRPAAAAVPVPKSPEESMKNEIEGVEKENSVKTARATDVKPALAKARMLNEACSAPSIIDIEYEGKKGAVNAIKEKKELNATVEGGERKETEAAVKCNKVKDSETAVDSYVGVKEAEAKDKAKEAEGKLDKVNSKDGDKGDEVKESEGQKAGDEGDGKKDSEAKPKGDGVNDSEAKPKGDGVKDSEAKPKGDGVNDSEAKPKGDGVNDSEAKPKGDGVKDSEAKPKGDGVKDSGTGIKGYEPVNNSRAAAEGADQVKISDDETESIDDNEENEERVVKVPASRKLDDKYNGGKDHDGNEAKNIDAEQGTDSKVEEEKLDVEQGTDSKVEEKLDAEQGTDSKVEEKLDAEQGTDSKVEEKLDVEQGTDSKVEEKLDVEQGTDSKVEERLDVEQGTELKVEEKLDAEQGTDSKVGEKIIDPKEWLNEGFIEGVNEDPPEPCCLNKEFFSRAEELYRSSRWFCLPHFLSCLITRGSPNKIKTLERKRRRGSANSSPAAAPSSNLGGARTNRRPQSSAGWAPRAQEVRTTRAHIVEARARQASSTEDHCVYVERSPELEPYHYMRAMDRMFGSTREVFQVTKMNGHFLVGLANRGMAERLVNEGLEVEGTLHRVFPFRKRAERITVGNLPFFVGDAAVISALTPLGRVTSIAPKLMKAGPYTYNDGRREAFIILREGMTIERLPTRLNITIKGEAWPAYLSSGIRCSRCRGQGHRRANCPLLAGRTNAPGPATPTSPTSVPSASAPGLPQQPSAQPPPPASPSPAMEVSEVPSTSRAALPPAAPRQSPPVAPATPTEMAPPAPPPVAPAPSLRAPGSHGPAVPTLDVEMSIKETSTFRAALKTSPAAVPPTPPLPAPQPAGPIPPAPDEEEMTPIMREECMVIEILKKLKHLTCLRPLYQSGIQPNDLKDAILFIDERESLMARLTPAMRGVLAEFLRAAIEPARGKHPDRNLQFSIRTHTHTLGRAARICRAPPFSHPGGCMATGGTPSLARAESPLKADQMPGRHGLKAHLCAEKSAIFDSQSNYSNNQEAFDKYANLPAGSKDVNLAAPFNLAANPSSNAVAQAQRNWADMTEDINPEIEDNFTLVQRRKRRRGSGNSPTSNAPSSNVGGSRTDRRPRSSTGWAPRAEEIRTTRAHIAEARAQQASSSEEYCVYIERSPDLEPFHYLRALDRMVGGTSGVVQVSKVNGLYLLGLTNRGLVERLISEGLEVEGTLLKAFPFRKRAERITVGNLPFFVADCVIINALSTFGRVTSIAPKLMKASPYIYNDGRREAFIALHEGVTIERLPTRLEIKIKGETWPAYLTSGIRCSRCHGQGHRRAICPLLAGLANNTRMAPPTTPAGVPPPTTPAPPQRSAAQPPAPASSDPASETPGAPPEARAVTTSTAPRPSPPVAPAVSMEKAPSAPPPVTPAPSLQAPEGPVGPRPANSQHPEPPPARPDFVAPRGPLPAQKTLGPAAPTPDVEMSTTEEPSAPSPAAVSAPPLPAPQPAGPTPSAPHKEDPTPAMTPPSLPPTPMEEDLPPNLGDCIDEILREIIMSKINPGPLVDDETSWTDAIDAILHPHSRAPFLARLSPILKKNYAVFFEAAIERARDSHPRILS